MTERRTTPPLPPEAGRLADLVADETTRGEVARLIGAGADPVGGWARLIPMIEADPEIVRDERSLRRACALAGGSRALSQAVARHPGLLKGEAPDDSVPMLARAALTPIAADDLAGVLDLKDAIAAFSADMDRLADDVLARARQTATERHPLAADLPFAVIAMGKWGGTELNYASDLDLVLVHEPSGEDDGTSRSAALALASAFVTALSARAGDGAGLIVDADLRPEGSRGPLCRSLASYAQYYARWGEPWELQALLKARPVAGDFDLGGRFTAMTEKLIWEEGLDVDALRSIRRLKEATEAGAKPSDIKRSRGGIRDVEFSVQLLQLVHGRLEPELRQRGTLDAIQALADLGFIEEEDRDRLEEAYRFLRDLEHRIQLWDLRQTQDVPADPERRAQLGRSLGMVKDPARHLDQRLGEVRSVVRDLHERLYFRPILDALVGSPSARLGIEEAGLRLEALGFRDVNAARRALEELTAGLSRRSRAMHQVLPLMLDWLSLSPDPDLGLAQLRIVLANTPDHAALVTLLQVNPLAGERLCRLLGSSRLIGDLIDRIGRVTGVGERAWAYAAAALRECREECALDLGSTRGLQPWSRWVTPLGLPKRFDTLFFVARAPDGQVPRPDEGETTTLEWVAPHTALEGHGTGAFPMEFATVATVRSLLPFASVATILAHASAQRELRVVHPRLALDAQHRITGVLLPGETGYDALFGDGP